VLVPLVFCVLSNHSIDVQQRAVAIIDKLIRAPAVAKHMHIFMRLIAYMSLAPLCDPSLALMPRYRPNSRLPWTRPWSSSTVFSLAYARPTSQEIRFSALAALWRPYRVTITPQTTGNSDKYPLIVC
jgi:hypothetical protein